MLQGAFLGSRVPGPEGEGGQEVGIQVSPAEQQLWQAVLPEVPVLGREVVGTPGTAEPPAGR